MWIKRNPRFFYEKNNFPFMMIRLRPIKMLWTFQTTTRSEFYQKKLPTMSWRSLFAQSLEKSNGIVNRVDRRTRIHWSPKGANWIVSGIDLYTGILIDVVASTGQTFWLFDYNVCFCMFDWLLDATLCVLLNFENWLKKIKHSFDKDWIVMPFVSFRHNKT